MGSRIKFKSKTNTTSVPMPENGNEIAQIAKMPEKMQATMEESDSRIQTVVVMLQDHNKEPHGKEVDEE